MKNKKIVLLFALIATIILISTGCANKKTSKDEVIKNTQVINSAENSKEKEDSSKKTQETTNSENSKKIEIKNLTEIQTKNLYKLGKIWGFLKYYHPEIAKGKLKYDNELFEIIPVILDADTNAAADKALSQWINTLGEIKEFETETTNTDKDNIKLSPNTQWIKDEKFLSKDLIKQLTDIEKAKRPTTNHYISLAYRIGNPVFKNELEYPDLDYTDSGYLLLSLFRYWNMIEYFFPYKYMMDENWDEILEEYIPKIIKCKDEETYMLTLTEIIGKLQDGHAGPIETSTWGLPDFFGSNAIPLTLDFVQDKVIITEIKENFLKDSKLKVGDIITQIDDKDISIIIEERTKYLKPSSLIHPNFILSKYLSITNKESVEITVEREGTTIVEKVNCITLAQFSVKSKKDSHKIIGDNIGYIYSGALESGEIHDIMKEFMNTKGLVIDLRCYPSDFIVFSLGNYLISKPTEFVKITSGSLKRPGEFSFTETLTVGGMGKEHYKGKVIIIINEKAISQPEYTTMALRVAPNATVIGDNTAGADGNVSHIILPGKVFTTISGIGIYYPDGEETQRIGIVPDIKIKPTIKGIREGRDELLEKAIELINE
ncbi:S41 family peptidase [Oceanirhabdus seepicola]|uniref:Tail specific protease domain-containing protein n=1 Tax=Oceanirhabdus seepicola TaxID=2828781 RepID=A0A9J6NW29_9CLOT|nr:S41 family peptidase [Oceanirhabdus seepicola]MCM1988260.1 hypothetical protein [Oceanirhabdus seepicola]